MQTGTSTEPQGQRSHADASEHSEREAPKKRTPRKKSTGSGVTGARFVYGQLIDDEKNTALKNEKAYEVYDLMRRTDTDVYQALEILKNPMLACPFVVEPASNEEIDLEIADFVASNLFEDLPWDRINRESLLRFDYGCYMFEQLTDVRLVERLRYPNLPQVRSAGRPARGELVPAVRWTSFEPRHPRTVIRWSPNADYATQLDSLVQRFEGDDQHPAGDYTISAENLVRFTHCQEGSNFAGRSVLRPMYADWRESSHLRKIEAVRHERQNLGIPVVSMPESPDPEEVNEIEEALEYISSFEQSYLLEPFGFKFRFDTSGEGDGTKLGERLKELRRSKLDTVLGGFMALGQDGIGSNALVNGQKDTQVDYVEVSVRYTEAVWNKGSDGMSPVRTLVDLNYGNRRAELGSHGYPKLRAKNVRGRHYLQVIKLVTAISQANLLSPENLRRVERFVMQALEIDGPALVSGDEGDDARGAREDEERPEEEKQAAPTPTEPDEDEAQSADADDEKPAPSPAATKRPAKSRKGAK